MAGEQPHAVRRPTRIQRWIDQRIVALIAAHMHFVPAVAVNHIHLIDSDGTLHGDETSTHAPFGDGILDYDTLIPELLQSGVPHDWWTIDLCFWPDAWAVTAQCKRAIDELNRKFAS